jgi:1-deoxy-D-xylulose-5-phosphate synthase
VLAEGRGLLLIGLGHMCFTALKIREILLAHGIEATVLDPIFVKPLDSELLCKLLIHHNQIATIEEHSVVSGLGSILNHFLMGQGYNNTQVLNFGVPETFIEQGSHSQLCQEIGLTPEKIAAQILQQFYPQKSRDKAISTTP